MSDCCVSVGAVESAADVPARGGADLDASARAGQPQPAGQRLLAAGRRKVERTGRRLATVGLAGVLADLDRQATPCDVPGDAAGPGFTWDEPDRTDPDWWPQGVASLRSGALLLVSWYARRSRIGWTRGSRITVVDRADPARPRYRHVLLVTPRRLRTIGRVPVHAGGVAVLDDLLYVADTRAGVRVFRLQDVMQVPRRRLDALLPWPRAGTRTLGRRLTGGHTAYGHSYVLPQLLRLRLSPGPGARPLKYSFVFLGTVEGRLSLVVGEYGRKGTSPRLACYPLDPTTGLPLSDTGGRYQPVAVHADAPLRMQGVAVHDGTWYVSSSAGEGNRGDLHVGRPGRFRRHRSVLPPGPEDLDWSVPGEQLWCQTEWPGHRAVFPIDPARWPGPDEPELTVAS